MRERALFGQILMAGVGALALTAGVSGLSWAADETPNTIRADRTEFYVFGRTVDGDSTFSRNGLGLPIAIDVDDTVLGGFGIGFNLTERLNLHTSFYGGTTDVAVDDTQLDRQGNEFRAITKDTAKIFGWDLNMDVAFFRTCLTPIVTGGAGIFVLDSDKLDYDTFGHVNFSTNVGAGVRWDFGKHMVMKAVYRGMWTQLEDTETLQVTGVDVVVGYLF